MKKSHWLVIFLTVFCCLLTVSYAASFQEGTLTAEQKEHWYWPVPGCKYLTRGFNTSSSGMHGGLDIAASAGSKVRATKDGTVVTVYSGCRNYNGHSNNCSSAGKNCSLSNLSGGYCNYGFGNGVVVLHSDGIYSYYGHMSSVVVSKGAKVEQGALLGYVGSSGNSTGPHLHFSIGNGGNIPDRVPSVCFDNNPNSSDFQITVAGGNSGNPLWSTDKAYLYDKNGISYTTVAGGGYLGVNGWLDGAEQSTLGEYGTFDMYINGSLQSNDINDYYAAHPQNTPYEIKDIKAKPGYDYLGVKRGSLKGNTSGALTMVVLSFSRQGSLVVSGQLDGVLDRSIEGYGTFDVYLDGKLDESGCTSYNKHLPNGTKYEIKNITAQTNKNYGGLTSLTGVVRSGNESSVVLAFTTDGTATTDWQVAKALPENLDRDTLDIEYKFNYVTKARTSPGDGWEMIEQGALQYENDGERYMLDTEKDTSDTCELVGYFYFHYCNYGTTANYYWKDYLPVRHTISMEYANSSFTVKEMGTDGDGSGRKYYYLTHTTGEYNGNIAKCSGNGSQVYYRGGVYQNKKTYRINTYSKTTDWSSTYDDAAAIASVRWRLKQYSVTFAPMGGTFDAETMTKYNGIDLFLPTNVPTYELHEFVAWNTMPDGSGDSYPAGGVYTVNEDVTLYAQWKEMGVMNLPKDVTVIEAQAFAGSSAAVVSIHDGCTKIGSKAFANCPNLCRIYIPASVTDIALDAFEGCPNLVIYAPAGSVAIRVAKYNDIPFNEE